MTAERVWGQGGRFDSATSALAANSFNLPQSVAVDAAGLLYVTDTGNNRVVVIDTAVR